MQSKKSSIQQQIFNAEKEYFEGRQQAWDRAFDYLAKLKRPNPPTAEAVKRAAFVDKTYVWKDNVGV